MKKTTAEKEADYKPEEENAMDYLDNMKDVRRKAEEEEISREVERQ